MKEPAFYQVNCKVINDISMDFPECRATAGIFDYTEFLLQGQVIEYNISPEIFTNPDRNVFMV